MSKALWGILSSNSKSTEMVLAKRNTSLGEDIMCTGNCHILKTNIE